MWGPKVGFKVVVEGIFSERRDNTVYAARDVRCSAHTRSTALSSPTVTERRKYGDHVIT